MPPLLRLSVRGGRDTIHASFQRASLYSVHGTPSYTLSELLGPCAAYYSVRVPKDRHATVKPDPPNTVPPNAMKEVFVKLVA